jgi:hypothetical protein
MVDSICKLVSGYDTSLRIKASNRVPAGLLSLLAILSVCGKKINIDFVTKLLVTENGNDSTVTIINGLTKRVCWLANKEAQLLAEKFATLFLDNCIRSYGISIAIMTDWDICSKSTFWKTFTKAIGIN